MFMVLLQNPKRGIFTLPYNETHKGHRVKTQRNFESGMKRNEKSWQIMVLIEMTHT